MTTEIRSRILALLGVLAYAGAAGAAIAIGDLRLIAAVVLLPVFVVAWRMAEAVPVLLIVLFFSLLKLPGAPDSLTLFYMVALLAVPLAVVRSAIEDVPTEVWRDRFSVFALLLVGVIIVTIGIRGFGIQALGGSAIGGFAYVQIGTTIGLVYVFRMTRLSERAWTIALVGMCCAAAVPFVFEFAVLRGLLPLGGVLGELVSAESVGQQPLYTGIGASEDRHLAGYLFSLWVLAGFLLLNPLDRRKLDRFVILGAGFVASIVVAGLSGHRLATLNLILVLGIFLLLETNIRFPNLVVATTAGILFVILLVALSGHLPLTIQRSLAWIPGFEAADVLNPGLEVSTNWRLEVWKIALVNELPDHWLVGKGLTFQPGEPLPYRVPDHYAWALRTRNYHNGPLSVLLTLGLPGLVAFLGCLGTAAARHFGIARREWSSSLLRHYHTVVYCVFLAQAVLFVFVFGDTHKSLPRLFFLIAVLEGLVASGYARFRKP